MGYYIPGSFKKKDLILEDYHFPDEDVDFSDEDSKSEISAKSEHVDEMNVIEDIVINPSWTIKKKNAPVDLIKTAEIIENETWKKFKATNEVKEKKKDVENVSIVKYRKMGIYNRRKKYLEFVENEWDNLWDIYVNLLEYDHKFLDRLRGRDDKNGFNEMSQVIFNHLY